MAKAKEPRELGGGVLSGQGLYSLEWPAPSAEAHPAFTEVLSDECVTLLSRDAPTWMTRFSQSDEDCDGEPLGEGRRFLADILPPACSSYAGSEYTVEIRPPEAYPETPPFVRFITNIEHALVHDYGDVADCFYLEANLKWSEKKPFQGLLHALEALRRMMVQLPEHLVLTSDEVNRLCLSMAPKFVGKSSEDKDEFEKAYIATLPRRQSRFEDLTRTVHSARHAYQPMNPELFDRKQFAWDLHKERIFHPQLLRVLNSSDSKKAAKALATKECPGVWGFPMFSDEFCDTLAEEFRNFEASDLPRVRPNSMNNYGLLLRHIGMEKFADQILHRVLKLFGGVFLAEFDAHNLDHHHSFIVKYKEGEDLSLDPHVDDSEVTLNVCLGREFDGGRLVLCGGFGTKDHRVLRATYMHKKGHAIVHAGKHRHGALKIEGGERINLIVWGKSSQYRRGGGLFSLRRHADEADPSLLCLSETHDRDYGRWKETLGTSA